MRKNKSGNSFLKEKEIITYSVYGLKRNCIQNPISVFRFFLSIQIRFNITGIKFKIEFFFNT